ncbi:MAG: copper amine oxidase N-terminal domain-containing protein [Paenibacillus sp.]|nr:copper amine oxidase N-terminal domain-containing protein [Paenibacillus sp.]
MKKVRFPAVVLSLFLLISMSPLTVSAPANVSASTINKSTGSIKVQNVNVKMIFDGVSMQPPVGQYVFVYNNTTYVPLRFVSYALQKSVSWDAKNVKVTVAEPSSSELVVIKEYLMNATNGNNIPAATKNITLNSVKASYGFNGTAKSVPAGLSSYMLNGSLYVPLRFLSESVGNEISWDQKGMTITASSSSYSMQNSDSTTYNNTDSTGKIPTASATPTTKPTTTPNSGAAGGGSGGAATGQATYESITSETEAQLSALQSQSQSTLMSIAVEYITAKDASSKASIKARGLQQLSSFTSSFNSILSDAESKLKAGGYSTDIISQYRAEFEAQLQQGQNLAAGMAD